MQMLIERINQVGHYLMRLFNQKNEVNISTLLILFRIFFFFLDILELLLANGANVHITDGDNRSLLHIACDNGDISFVKYLVEKGVSLKGKDKNGWTPLHIACGPADDYELVYYLIQNGADIYAYDANQHTPLDLATQFQAKKVQRYLKVLQNLDSDTDNDNDDLCSDLGGITNDTYESDNVFESEPVSNRVSQKSNISLRMMDLTSNKQYIVKL